MILMVWYSWCDLHLSRSFYAVPEGYILSITHARTSLDCFITIYPESHDIKLWKNLQKQNRLFCLMEKLFMMVSFVIHSKPVLPCYSSPDRFPLNSVLLVWIEKAHKWSDCHRQEVCWHKSVWFYFYSDSNNTSYRKEHLWKSVWKAKHAWNCHSDAFSRGLAAQLG